MSKDASIVATYAGSALAISSWSDIGVVAGIVIGLLGLVGNLVHNARMEAIAKERAKQDSPIL